MQTPTTDEKDAAVTPDVIAVTRRPEREGIPSTDKELINNEITEKLLDATGLLALERVEKKETERQYEDLIQSINNSKQVQLLTDLVEERRNENRALADENRRLVEQLQRMRLVDSMDPVVNCAHQQHNPTKYRPSLGGSIHRSSLAPKTLVPRSSPEIKQLRRTWSAGSDSHPG